MISRWIQLNKTDWRALALQRVTFLWQDLDSFSLIPKYCMTREICLSVMIPLHSYHSTWSLTHECRGPRFHNAAPESAVASRWKGSGPAALQVIRRTQITGNLPQFKCYITVTNYCASRENSSRKINNGRLSIHLETSCLNSCFQRLQSAHQAAAVFFPSLFYYT